MGTVRDQVVIITGGSAGIGLALAVRLAYLGAPVVLVGRDPNRLAGAAAEVRSAAGGASVDALSLDVRRNADMQRMAAFTLERHGRIDALVSCAGILRPAGGRIKMLRDATVADWNEILDVNLKGVFLSNQAVLPAMIAQRHGQIVNLSSTSGLRGHAFDAAYCASKFAVLGLTESLAEEVRPYNIRVQAVLPGATESMIWEQNGPIPRPLAVLPVERLVESIIHLLALPGDAVVPRLVVEPTPAETTEPTWLRASRAH